MADDKPPSHPQDGSIEISRKRKLILDNALRIMRRKREIMDKSVLSVIKDMVTSNPALSKALGYEAKEKPKPAKPAVSKLKQPEIVDQGHNMEVLAKLMELDPQSKDKVKEVIKKSVKS